METTAPQGFFGRLGGLLGPQGLTPEEQAQLGRSGLLQAGLGILANNHDRYNAGAAVGSGLLAGVSAMQKGGEDALDRKLKAQQVMRMGGDPAGFRTVDMLARAAGYEPGSEEYKQFMRVAGGTEGRASNAGVTFDTFTDAAGNQRPQRNNPRTGAVELWYDEQGRWVPLGEGLGGSSGAVAPPQAPRSASGSTSFTTSTGEPFDVSVVTDPVLREQIMENPEAWGMVPSGTRAQLPAQDVATFTPAPIPGLGRGRRAEDEAAAVEKAKTNVQLGALPTELGMRTDAAVRQATEIERGKAGVEREAAAPKRIKQYEQNLAASKSVRDALDRAIDLTGPKTTGWAGARMRNIEGSDAFDLASQIETVKANLGFDRLQQMRDNSPTGGALGAIAVQELVALQSTIANLDPDQSSGQLKANLQKVQQHYKNWEAAVQQALADEKRSGGGAAPAAGQRTIVRTGTANGRKVIQYSDGSVEYGN